MKLEDGIITIDRTKKKKVKCFKFYHEALNRFLMVHKDIDNPEYISLSDFSSGYRLFKIHGTIEKVDMEKINQELEKYIEHFTSEGIKEEIERLTEKEESLRKTK